MASKSLNKVMLIGNVTRDPELRYTPQGNAVCTVGLATNRSWKTDSGEMREEAEFHRLVAWNKLAELCSQLLTKGRKIYVEGRLQTRTFTGSDNASHTITEIVIDDMILLDSKIPGAMASHGGFGGQTRPVQAQPAPSATADDSGIAATTSDSDQAEVSTQPTPKSKKKPEDKNTEGETPSEGVKEDVNIDDIPF